MYNIIGYEVFLKFFKLFLYWKIVVNIILVYVFICVVDEMYVVELVYIVIVFIVENKLYNYIFFRI